MQETWNEMEDRHARERTEMLRKISKMAYRQGAESQPLHTPVITGVAGINAMVAAKYGMKANKLLERTRVSEVSWRRFEAFSIAHKNGYSLSQIGRFYGLDHTSVLHGIRRHKKLSEANGCT